MKGIITAGQALHPPPTAAFRGKPRGMNLLFLTRPIMSAYAVHTRPRFPLVSSIRGLLFPLVFFVFTLPVFPGTGSLEAENLERVKLSLDNDSIPFEERPLLADYGGFGSSVLVRGAGSAETRQGTFVFAVPLGAGFAVDTALALAGLVRSRSSGVNIIVAFLGDESSSLPPGMGGLPHKGLRDLLSLVDMPENWILCYFDAAEAPRELSIRHGIRGYVAPLDIIEPLPRLFSAYNIPWSFRIRYNEIYKLGLVEGPEAIATAWAEEINSFVLSGKSPEGEAAPGETVPAAALADLLSGYAGTLDFPVIEADRHYFAFFQSAGGAYFFSEGFTAAMVLIVSGCLLFLFLAYSVLYNAALAFNIRLFFKNIWVFAILLPLMVLAVKISGSLYSLFLRLSGLSASAQAATDYAGTGLIALLAATLFFLPSPLLNFVHLPRRARFYGFSAVIFVSAGLVTAAFLDLTYVPVFLWALFFVILGASLSNPVLIFFCTLLVPVFSLGVLINIIETGSGIISGLFISPRWNTPASWLAASQFGLLSLPVLLLVKRGMIMIQKSRRGHEPVPDRKYRLAAVPVLAAVLAGAMIVQIRLIPEPAVPPERRFIEDKAGAGSILNLSLDDTVFQDSRIIAMRLEARGKPVRLDISLESGDGGNLLPVYSAPVPFERTDGGKRIDFLLGENPPDPLVMEIVVPLGFEGFIRTGAVYNTWDPQVDPGPKPGSPGYVLEVRETVFESGNGPWL